MRPQPAVVLTQGLMMGSTQTLRTRHMLHQSAQLFGKGRSCESRVCVQLGHRESQPHRAVQLRLNLLRHGCGGAIQQARCHIDTGVASLPAAAAVAPPRSPASACCVVGKPCSFCGEVPRQSCPGKLCLVGLMHCSGPRTREATSALARLRQAKQRPALSQPDSQP